MSAAAFPVDPRLPEFATACDLPRMTELLRRHLRPRNGAQIEGCSLEEFRYRPEKRSILRYRAYMSGAEEPFWVTGALYHPGRSPGRARVLADEMTAASASGGWDRPFEPVAFLPEIGMVLQVYPFDRRLPALRLLAEGPTPELAARLAEAAGIGASRPKQWTSELVRYRPEQCAVFRYTLCAGGSSHRFYVKLYSKSEDLAVHRSLSVLNGRTEGFAVPRVVADLSELRVLALGEVPGTPLDRLLERGDGIAAHARAIGASLAAFNSRAALPERRFTTADRLVDLHRAVPLVRWARPDLDPTIVRIVERVSARLEDVNPAATHRDLKLDHILVDDHGPALVDLDSCAAADPVLDPATLLARMFAAPCERPVGNEAVRAAMTAFSDGYFTSVPGDWRSRVGPHYATALLEAAKSVFRRQVSGWSSAIAGLVDEADRALA